MPGMNDRYSKRKYSTKVHSIILHFANILNYAYEHFITVSSIYLICRARKQINVARICRISPTRGTKKNKARRVRRALAI